MIYVKYYSYLSIINKWVFYFKMFDNHGVFQKIYLQENLILSYYPRPADSIGHYVGLSVCLSVGPKFFHFSNFSALGLDRELGFSRGPSFGIPP